MSGFNENILVERSQQYFLAATHDPSVIATQGAKGTLYLRVGPLGGQIYQKQDDGTSTNWSVNGTFTGSVVQDNGVTVGTNVVTLNFIGAVVTNPSPGVVNIQIAAGGLTAAANVGLGAGVFRDITGGNTLNLRSLVAGANITITQNADDITIAAANSAPTGTANTAAYFDNLGNLASEAAFGYDAAQNFLSVGTVTSVGSNNVMGIGATVAISGVTSNMIVVGNNLSPSNGQNSYVGGNNYSVIAPLRSVITGDSHTLAAVTGIQNSLIGGASINTTGGGTIANSIVAGGGFIKSAANLTSSVVAGNGNTSSAILSNSLFVGTTITQSATFNNGIISGSGHTLSGTGTLDNNIVGGTGNTLNNGPDNNLIVGNGNQLQLNCARNIVGGNLNNISSTNVNNLVVGDNNTLQIQASNNVVAGQGVTLNSNSSRNLIAGSAYSTGATIDSMITGSNHTILSGLTACVLSGQSASINGLTISSVIVGTSVTSNAGANNSYLGGRLNTMNGSVTASVIVGEEMTAQSISRSIVSGFQNNISSSVTNSLLLSNVASLASVDNSILAGAGISTVNPINQSCVIGTTISLANTVNNSFVTGSGLTMVTGSINNSVMAGAGSIRGSYDTCLMVANTVSGGGSHNTSLIVGSTLTIANLTGCAIVGSEINATSAATGSSAFGVGLTVDSSGANAQCVVGRYNVLVTNARFIVGNGTGVGTEENALVVRQSGMMERTQAGLSVKIRIDAGATVTVAQETDYAVVSTAAASNIDLPANPRQGQEVKLKSVAGSTVNPAAGDTIDGAPSLALAAQEAAILIYDLATTTWYRMN